MSDEADGRVIQVIKLKKHLQRAVGFLEHEVPQPDHDHSCSNPDDPCDQICVDFAYFCTCLKEMKDAAMFTPEERSQLKEKKSEES